MGMRKKFMCLTVLVSVVLIVVSAIGYYNAQKYLATSIEQEMDIIVQSQANEIDNWLMRKAQIAVVVGNTLSHLPADVAMLKELTSSMEGDKDLQELVNGNEQGQYVRWGTAPVPADYDPRTRGWYKEAKAANGLIFTNAYVDAFSNKQVVTASYPYKNAAGAFQGALCADISLEVLGKQVETVKLNGNGEGFIIDKSGMVIAAVDKDIANKKIEEDPVLKPYVQQIMGTDHGNIHYEQDGSAMILTYAKAANSGWVIAMKVSQDVVYAELASLKWSYGIISLIGILMMTAVSMRFAATITKPILALTAAADKLAEGDLRAKKLQIHTNDEIGRLTTAFNTMSDNLRDLIHRLATSSEHMASASEELTAGAQQSAEAANHVAQTITRVAQGTATQMQTMTDTTSRIDQMASEVGQVSDKTKRVSEISDNTAQQAQKGDKLMTNAIQQMGFIEKTVNESAATVVRLGENSKQIGQIVSVISGIAGQTNLLALNAAIEAARAGEQGRGFAVVAEEVRKLAEQSQQATEEISKLIASIQQDTAQAVQAMETGTSEVKNGSEAINQVGDTFKDIMNMVDEISAQMQGIAKSVEEVDSGSGRVVNAIKQVNEVSQNTASQTQTISAATEQQSASMEEIASSAQTLAQMAQEMQEMVGKFKI